VPFSGRKESAMYKRILIPTDGSPLSAMAIEKGIGLAKATGAKVVGMTVSVPFHIFALDPMMVSDTRETYKKNCEEVAAKCLSAVKTAASAAGVPCDVVHVIAEHPYEGIIETAKGQGCDLIFMASHGRKGVSALVLGSETLKVLTHSKIPVLVCR
jgi:nucleotide-binding universal stress UspA family protein